MKPRLPLFAKIIGWFFVNLAVLALAGWLVVRQQFQISALPARAALENVERMAAKIVPAGMKLDRSGRDALFEKQSTESGVTFYLYGANGMQLAGPIVRVPPDVHSRLFAAQNRPGGPLGPLGRRPPDGPPGPRFAEDGPRFADDGPPRQNPPPPPIERGLLESTTATRYWCVVPVGTLHPDLARGAVFLAASNSATGNGFFFDVRPYLWAGVGVLLLSALVWLPFVRGLTRSIGRLRGAAARLAEGDFEVRVEDARRDELGELGGDINRMAGRLAGYVQGQKRFLGDVAHELCAPTARLQMGVSVLEQRAPETERERIADVREEIEHMAALVNELLQFSRASLGGKAVQLQPVELLAVAEKAVRRESADTTQVRVAVPAGLRAIAEPELLQRAIGNLVRNAIRYAGHAGPILVTAEQNRSEVFVSVADSGPGIPADALPRIFDPFYRVDAARVKESGGTGLGLAIVKTCIAACQGSVTARNVRSAGLEVTLRLKAEGAD